MDKVQLQLWGALCGSAEVPSQEEIKLSLERQRLDKAEHESERQHQVRLHRHLSMLHVPHYAPYNEGHQGEKEGWWAKKMGMSPGICDIVVVVARRPWHGLYIELKAKPHGKVSGAQEWWLKTLLMQNYQALVSWSFEESIKIVADYLALPLWTVESHSHTDTSERERGE